MKLDRRDLLKCFSAGAVITSLDAGAHAARIIEPPKVEMVPLIEVPIDYSQVKSATVTMEMFDGAVRQLAMDCRAYRSREWAELTVHRNDINYSPMDTHIVGSFRGAVTLR